MPTTGGAPERAMTDDDKAQRRKRRNEGAALMVSSGLDEARAYMPPRQIPSSSEHKTFEMQRVQVLDPRKVPTQKRLDAGGGPRRDIVDEITPRDPVGPMDLSSPNVNKFREI